MYGMLVNRLSSPVRSQVHISCARCNLLRRVTGTLRQSVVYCHSETTPEIEAKQKKKKKNKKFTDVIMGGMGDNVTQKTRVIQKTNIKDLLRTPSAVPYQLQSSNVDVGDAVNFIQKSSQNVANIIRTNNQQFSQLRELSDPGLTMLETMIVESNQEIVNSQQYLSDLQSALKESSNSFEDLSKVANTVNQLKSLQMSLLGLLPKLSFPETTLFGLQTYVAGLSHQSSNLISEVTPSLTSISQPTQMSEAKCDLQTEADSSNVFDERSDFLEKAMFEPNSLSSQHDMGDVFVDTEAIVEKHGKDKKKGKKKKEKKKKDPKDKKKTKKQMKEEFAVQMEEVRALNRERSLISSMHSYLQVSFDCGLDEMGLQAFNRVRNKLTPVNRKHMAPVYNTLLKYKAKQGDLGSVEEWLRTMKSGGVARDIHTYAAILLAYSHTKTTEAKIAETIKDVNTAGLTLHNIFNEVIFESDERARILSTIRRVETDYTPVINPPVLHYSCTLVDHLNSHQHRSNLSSPCEGVLDEVSMREATKSQLNLEHNGMFTVDSIMKDHTPASEKKSDHEMFESKSALLLEQSFRKRLSVLAGRSKHEKFTARSHQVNLLPYLTVLPVHHYVDVMMQEVKAQAKQSLGFSPTTKEIYKEIGWRIFNRYIIQVKSEEGYLEKLVELYRQYTGYISTPYTEDKWTPREFWQMLQYRNQEGTTLNSIRQLWPVSALHSIGYELYHIMMKEITLDLPNSGLSCPAFYKVYRERGIQLREEIKTHPLLTTLYDDNKADTLSFPVALSPMLSPPLPWTSMEYGANLLLHNKLIRVTDRAQQQKNDILSAPAKQMYPVLDSLTVLGTTPWRVNKPILDVMVEVFTSGGDPQLSIPRPQSSFPQSPPLEILMSTEEKMRVIKEQQQLRKEKLEMYTLWCDTLYKLSIAKHYSDQVLFFPHNLDFRGRVYPLSPYLNHMGDDVNRGILQFAKGKPLGPKGYDWLKIHLVNLTEIKKKESVSSRLEYAEELMPDILDSANNPLTGRGWWKQFEDPWQTLSVCKEIAAVSTHPDPTAYISHLPVHQDGSCNGLQHYAALGRDVQGAIGVNLAPQHVPSDVYQRVANIVERERAKDAAAGMKIAQELEGYIARKVIKQTVMTTVYGVTRFGAKLQIARQLKDKEGFPRELVFAGSNYLTNKVFFSLKEMFTSAKDIQDWLTRLARQIAKLRSSNVEWMSPLGLPIVQPYSRATRDSTKLNVGNMSMSNTSDIASAPNVMKQKNAFPPNFIHSLDSTHMMLTSLMCEREGLTYASIHDCYWTHACSVDTMNKICREQFIEMHSQPILEDLSRALDDKFRFSQEELNATKKKQLQEKLDFNNDLTAVPEKGDFDLQQIHDSIYFFS